VENAELSQDPVAPVIVLAPRLVVVARGVAEGAEYALEIVLVFQSDVLLDDRNPFRDPSVGIAVLENG
jgi:hypothetical protein